MPFPSLENDERLATTLTPVPLGASFTEVPTDLLAKEGLPAGAVRIATIDPEPPARAAGLRTGDIILGTPGTPVSERGAMKIHLASSLRSPTSELEIRRDRRRLNVVVPARNKPNVAPEPDLPAAGRAALPSLVSYEGALAETVNGRKPHLLFFWATWCGFCKDAVPELLALERQRGIKIVAITDEPPAEITRFFQSWTKPFPKIVALDLNRRVNEAFQIDGYPTFIYVDENGRVPMWYTGYRRQKGLPIEGWVAPRNLPR